MKKEKINYLMFAQKNRKIRMNREEVECYRNLKRKEKQVLKKEKRNSSQESRAVEVIMTRTMMVTTEMTEMMVWLTKMRKDILKELRNFSKLEWDKEEVNHPEMEVIWLKYCFQTTKKGKMNNIADKLMLISKDY